MRRTLSRCDSPRSCQLSCLCRARIRSCILAISPSTCDSFGAAGFSPAETYALSTANRALGTKSLNHFTLCTALSARARAAWGPTQQTQDSCGLCAKHTRALRN
jgi:hypothetical protein